MKPVSSARGDEPRASLAISSSSPATVTTLGQRLRIARERARLSQAALASACGWDSQGRVGNYERDEREPTIRDLALVAQALNVRLEWLVTGRGVMAAAAEVREEPAHYDTGGRRTAVTLPERLRALLDAHDLNQTQLGVAAGVSRAAVSKWMAGVSQPDLASLRNIARRLRVDLNWLETGRGAMAASAEAREDHAHYDTGRDHAAVLDRARLELIRAAADAPADAIDRARVAIGLPPMAQLVVPHGEDEPE